MSGKWRRSENTEPETLCNDTDELEIIRRRILRWVGHACRTKKPLTRIVLEENPVGEILMGRPQMRWKNVINKGVVRLEGWFQASIQGEDPWGLDPPPILSFSSKI